MKAVSILGCGWLGKAVAEHLISLGYPVKGSVTKQSSLDEIITLGIEGYQISLTNELTGERLNDFFSADVLLISVPPRRKTGNTEDYLKGMTYLSNFLKSTAVKQIIFISSTSVYPDKAKQMFEEDADSQSFLVQAENLFLTLGHSVVLRLAGLVGPGRHPGKFLAGKKDVSGAFHPINLIHQEDCVKAIAAVIRAEEKNEIFNVCANFHPTRKEFYEAACRQLNLEPPVFNDDRSSSKIIMAEKIEKNHLLKFSDSLIKSFMID